MDAKQIMSDIEKLRTLLRKGIKGTITDPSLGKWIHSWTSQQTEPLLERKYNFIKSCSLLFVLTCA